MCTETGSKIRLVKAIVHNIYISTCPVLQLLESLFFPLWFVTTIFFITYERTQTSLFSEHVHIRDVFIFFFIHSWADTQKTVNAKRQSVAVSLFFLLYIFLLFFSRVSCKTQKALRALLVWLYFFPLFFKKFPPLSTFSSLLFSSFD